MTKTIYEVINNKKVLVYEKMEGAWERSYEYDSNGNLTYKKDHLLRFGIGTESWYDSNGNTIHIKAEGGYEVWMDYDSNNHKIHSRDNEGWESWYAYGPNGKCIHSWDTRGREWFDYGYKQEYKNSCKFSFTS